MNEVMMNVLEAEIAARQAIELRRVGRYDAVETMLNVAQLFLLETPIYRRVWGHRRFERSVEDVIFRIRKAVELSPQGGELATALSHMAERLRKESAAEAEFGDGELTLRQAERLMSAVRAGMDEAVFLFSLRDIHLERQLQHLQKLLLRLPSYACAWSDAEATDSLEELLDRMELAARQAPPDDFLVAPALQRVALNARQRMEEEESEDA